MLPVWADLLRGFVSSIFGVREASPTARIFFSRNRLACAASRRVWPTLGANQGDEAHFPQLLRLKFHLTMPDHPHQMLLVGSANRYDQTTTYRELRLQRLRDRRAFSRDHNPVVGSVCRPTQRAIARQHLHIVESECPQALASRRGEGV
jgi:hypothetical protein